MTAPPFHAYIIDDDASLRQSLVHLLEQAGFVAAGFADARRALTQIASQPPDVILSDVRMPGMTGLELLGALQAQPAPPPLVLISAHGDIPTAVGAMQQGAYSFLEKPFDPHRLLSVLRNAARTRRLQMATQRMQAELGARSGLDRVLMGQDTAIARLRDAVFDMAAAQGSVLISGETGTGKELVARALHNLGPRRDAPFVAINCATIAADRFDEQVFGTADGARGLLRSADGGTLFLDEIGTCPPPAQAKLLRVLETGDVRPVGADQEIGTDLRIVAATQGKLDEHVSAGTFRADLLFRLNTFELHLPRLADRGEDVLRLFRHFLDQIAQTWEISPPTITTEDAAALLAHDWPGNVRELRHVAERRVLAARRGGGSVRAALQRQDTPHDIPDTLREAVATFERTLIAKAIRSHNGRMDAVAEALGIGRRTLNEKIVKLGLDKAQLLD